MRSDSSMPRLWNPDGADPDEDMAQANDGTRYSTENENITALSDAERERHWEQVLGTSTVLGADSVFQA